MSTARILHVSQEEYQRRISVFDQAVSTLAMEGIAMPEDARALAERYACGEIEFDTFSALCDEAIEKRAQ